MWMADGDSDHGILDQTPDGNWGRKHVIFAVARATSYWSVITSLSIGKDTGIVALEGVVEKTFPKALEDHLLACKFLFFCLIHRPKAVIVGEDLGGKRKAELWPTSVRISLQQIVLLLYQLVTGSIPPFSKINQEWATTATNEASG